METVHEIVQGRKRPASFNKSQPRTTLSGSPIKEIPWALPYWTESLCPVCLKVVRARKFAEDGKVFLEKECVTHGYFKGLISSDVNFYMRIFTERSPDGGGVLNPNIANASSCPADCGICNMHCSNINSAIIEMTPDIRQEMAVQILKKLREIRPSPPGHILLAGDGSSADGEYSDIIRSAKRLGFKHLHITDAKSIPTAREAGADSILLQVEEGETITPDTIGLCRKMGMKMTLLSRLNGNDPAGRTGCIIKSACDNTDVIRSVLFITSNSYTIFDAAKDIADRTDNLMPIESWRPLSCFPFFAGCHPDYGAGGYLKGLFIGAIYLQDAVNFDVECAKRDVIHYAMPDGKIYPFSVLNLRLKRPASAA